jgi:integrase
MSGPDYTIGKLRGKFCLIYWDGCGKRHRYNLGTTDPREANNLAPAIYAELTKPKGTTVESLWEGYQADMRGRAVITTMGHTFKSLRDRFGPMEASSISVADCRAHIDNRRLGGIKDGTIHTELGHLRMILLWAEKRKLIERAPYIGRPAKPKSEKVPLTKDEVYALRDACEVPHMRLFVLLAYRTAARSAALLGLRWDRVDLERGKIDLRDPSITTPHKGRAIVPISDTTRAALAEARAGALTPYVIEWAGKPVRSVKKGLATAARKAELGKVSPHLLRHSAACHMAEAGVPMEAVAQFLGHSDVSVTRTIYAKFSNEFLQDAAQALELDDARETLPSRRLRQAG